MSTTTEELRLSKGRIVVVRHGNTPSNTAQIFQPLDSPLSEMGWRQAKSCGERLAKEVKAVKILTSDLPRTKQTTACILDSMSRPVPVVENALLRERDFGSLVGSSIFDAPRELFRRSLPHFAPEGGESWHTFYSRVDAAWEWVLAEAEASIENEDECVVVVTHGLVKTRLAKLWGQEDKPRIIFENTSVSIVTTQRPHVIEVINSYHHLDDSQVGGGGGESKL